MTAKRVNGLTDLDDAAVCYWRDEYGLWWVYQPQCGAGALSKHTIHGHEDGRGDYRLVAINSKNEAPAFFGPDNRYGHRVSGGLLFGFGQ
jgi:hypothetical protein